VFHEQRGLADVNILMLAEVSIAQVTSGGERVLWEQARGLAARGHVVRVLTRMGAAGDPERIAIGGVTETRYAVDRRSAVAFLYSSVQNARRTLESLVRESQPDVLVVHQALPGLAACCSVGPIPRVYVCLSLAHEEFEARNKPPDGLWGHAWHKGHVFARRLLERAVIRRVCSVIVLSDFMRQRVVQHHRVAPERVRIVAGGVDPVVFSPDPDHRAARAALKLEGDTFILFTVRNLEPRMGIDTLICAIGRLRDSIPRLLLLIGGSGPLRSELETQVKESGLEGCVRFVGFIPEALLPAYYRAADLFVLPTARLEGFGLVTVEALAAGTPVFGTPVGATREILGKLDAALLAESDDAESLASGIGNLYRRFATDRGLRARLAAEGRALVLQDYTWARHCEQVEAVLSEALSHYSRSHR
jgi:glycosyltransferase involved in cell wall biosynthesis